MYIIPDWILIEWFRVHVIVFSSFVDMLYVDGKIPVEKSEG